VTGDEFAVSGEQVGVNEAAGTSRMTGGLIGLWKITSFKELATKPVFKAQGTESFKGCIDTDHDGSCSGEPHGTMTFSFRYWGQFTAKDEILLGTCAHPVTGGTEGFGGARGFLMMVDTPTKKAPFVKTRYQGVITLGNLSRPAARQAVC
jgi:hypothetical protein